MSDPQINPNINYWDLNAWSQYGLGNDVIFDSTTGQLKPGWIRTGRGYENPSIYPNGPSPVYSDPTPPPGGGGGTGSFDLGSLSSAPTSFDWPTYNAPGYIDTAPFDPGPAFTFADFSAPDPSQVAKDPAFQFRFDQGVRALNADRAGKGVFNSGERATALTDYGQNAASQEYDNIWNRALTGYNTNRTNAFSNWASQYGQRKDAYGFQSAENANKNAFNLSNSQFDYTGRNQQANAQFQDLFSRWSKTGDWLTQLANNP